MPGPNRRGLLKKRASIQVDHFDEDEEDLQFKVPKFQPLSTRYKKFEAKREKEEEKVKLLKKQKAAAKAEEEEAGSEETAERNKIKMELEKVQGVPIKMLQI